MAISLLRWTLIAQRALTASELSVDVFLTDEEREHQIFPTRAVRAEYAGHFKCCEPFLYRDARTDTISLSYQSVKDYLLSPELLQSARMSEFHMATDAINLLIFETCWR